MGAPVNPVALSCLAGSHGEAFFNKNASAIAAAVKTASVAFATAGRMFLAADSWGFPIALHARIRMLLGFELKRPALPAILLGESGALFMAGGDAREYENILARELESLCVPGDVLLLFDVASINAALASLADRAREMAVHIIPVCGEGSLLACGKAILLPDVARPPEAQALCLAFANFFCSQLDDLLFENPKMLAESLLFPLEGQ